MNKKGRITQINEKLNNLGDYLRILKGFGKVSAEYLEENEVERGAIERYLQLASEVVFDVAGQLIAEFRFPTPENYKESILILGKEKVLPQKFAKDFADIAGFRNILVHEYFKIDYKIVADILNNRLGDFNKFAQAVAKYLK